MKVFSYYTAAKLEISPRKCTTRKYNFSLFYVNPNFTCKWPEVTHYPDLFKASVCACLCVYVHMCTFVCNGTTQRPCRLELCMN